MSKHLIGVLTLADKRVSGFYRMHAKFVKFCEDEMTLNGSFVMIYVNDYEIEKSTNTEYEYELKLVLDMFERFLLKKAKLQIYVEFIF